MEQRDGFSLEEAEAWVRRAMDDSGEDRKYAIVVEGYDEPVGFTALYGLFRQTAPELGALIGDDVRGKGVGRRAEALTLAKAFDEFGAHRVYGRIPARNEVAKKTVAGLGWKHEGTMRAHLRRAGRARRRLRGLGSAAGRVPRRRRGPAGVSAPRADAELLEDRGAAAAGEEFFRSRQFLDAEGVTHTLRIEADEARAARPADRPGDPGAARARRDLPLRLPGLVRGASDIDHAERGRRIALDPAVDWSATGLVSALRPPRARRAAAARRRQRAQRRPDRRPGAAAEEPHQRPPPDPQEPARAATRCELSPAPRRRAEQRAGFLAAYEQTMRRTGAAERYFFGAALLRPHPRVPRTWLALAHAPGGEVAAASIAALSDGFLHYYLSGSADAHLRDRR